MNSSDDSIDRQLRRQFQQVFDAFEVAPADSLKARIWKARPNAAPYRYLWSSVLLIGVLLLTGGVYYRSLFVFPTVSERKNEVDPRVRPSPIRSTVDVAATAPRSKDRMWREAVRPVLMPGKRSDADKPAEVSTPSGPVLAQRMAKATGAGRRSQATRWGRMKKRISQIPVDQTTSADLSISIAQSATISKKPPQLSPPTLERLTDDGATLPRTASSPATESSRLVSDANVAFAEPIKAWPTLQPIGWRPASGLSAELTRTIMVSPPPASALTSQPVRPAPLRWFVRVAPLSTSQRMTVVAKPGTRVAHVDVPSAWSGETWGYQLSGGITWRQWDVYVSYGQVRRWAYYQLATNDYEVEPVGINEYQVTRRARTVAENVSLPMLGAGLSRQYTLGRQKRYYGRIGGQVTYAPNSRQTLAWTQASLGLNLSLGQTYQLQVGPVVDYGLSRLWSTERQLRIHPYLAGFSITLRP